MSSAMTWRWEVKKGRGSSAKDAGWNSRSRVVNESVRKEASPRGERKRAGLGSCGEGEAWVKKNVGVKKGDYRLGNEL